MHFVLSALLICAFVVLLLAGLASVLRDMLARDLRPLVMPRAQRALKSKLDVRPRSPITRLRLSKIGQDSPHAD